MQQDYLHGVPAQTQPAVDVTVNTSNQEPDKRRLVLIFRRGLYKEFQSASGTPCTALDFAPMPRPKPYTFGPIPGLVIGGLTTRQQLVELGAHKYVLVLNSTAPNVGKFAHCFMFVSFYGVLFHS